MKTKFILLALLVPLIACSDGSDYSDSAADYESYEEATEAGRVAPDIDPSAAPGVAFEYSMRLGVPDDRIAELQERHADACEEMGLTRCQIVGMQYDRSDEGRVYGQLTFLLGPADARSFARDAVSSAEEVDGTLLSSRFRGEEVQTSIDDSQTREQGAAARLAEIEAALNRGGLSDDRRTQLEAEAANLRSAVAAEQQSQQAGERRLAKSPLTIDYAGEYSYGRKPLGQIGDEAAQAGRTSLTALFTLLVYFFAVVLPWLLVTAGVYYGGWWLFSRARSWFQSRRDARHDAGD